MSDRDILDQIDDVITWHGSRDAMVWTAEPPRTPTLPVPDIDPQAARQLLVNLGAQVRAFAEALRPAVEQTARNFAEMTRAFAAIVSSPEMRELIDVQRLQRREMKTEYARRRRGRRR